MVSGPTISGSGGGATSGQRDLKGRSLVDPCASRDAPTAVNLDQSLDDREPYPDASLGAIQCPLALREEVEDSRQKICRNTGAVIRDLNGNKVASCFRQHSYLAVIARVFRGIREHVR